MDFHPQVILGSDGLPSNVVIPFAEWQQLEERLGLEIPEEIIAESRRRLAAYRLNPESAIDGDEFLAQLDKEDAEEI